jgi:hypothetical protein
MLSGYLQRVIRHQRTGMESMQVVNYRYVCVGLTLYDRRKETNDEIHGACISRRRTTGGDFEF